MIRKFYPFKSIIQKKWLAYVMIVFAALLYTIGINAFIQTVGAFSVGIGSIAALITFMYKGLLPFYSLIYLVLNIPLIIIFWKKVKRQFIYRTTFFLIVQALLGSLFTIDEVSNGFYDMVNGHDIEKNGWPIIVLPIFGGLICGFGIATAYRFGASSGGTDIIVFYLSTKKKISIGKIALLISIIILVFSFSLSMIISAEKRENWYLILLGTSLSAMISSTIIDATYPKYSIVRLEIHSDEPNKIKNFLSNSSNHHSYFSFIITSGYTKKDREVIQTSVLLLEAKPMIKKIREIDPHVWVSTSKENNIVGNFNTKFVD